MNRNKLNSSLITGRYPNLVRIFGPKAVKSAAYRFPFSLLSSLEENAKDCVMAHLSDIANFEQLLIEFF